MSEFGDHMARVERELVDEGWHPMVRARLLREAGWLWLRARQGTTTPAPKGGLPPEVPIAGEWDRKKG